METLENTYKWKPTHIFPQEYLVSNNGAVLSLRSNKILRPGIDKSGYNYYVLCVNGERKTIKAHRLVAAAFIDNPYNKETVNHINGIRTDNRVENLEWATHKEQKNDPLTRENMKRVYANTDYKAMGEKRDFGRKRVRITRDSGEVIECQSLLEAARYLYASYSHLSEVLNGKCSQRKAYKVEWVKNEDRSEDVHS